MLIFRIITEEKTKQMPVLKRRKTWLYIMVMLYIAAGINHFISTAMYTGIMPPWLPYKELLVFVSGFFEMLFAVLLLFEKTRYYAAAGIILLLIVVFPANIQMSINYYNSGNTYFWFTIARLPLQLVLIWWAYMYTKPAVSG